MDDENVRLSAIWGMVVVLVVTGITTGIVFYGRSEDARTTELGRQLVECSAKTGRPLECKAAFAR